ncbi:MAG: DUF374 domain-containing protein [Planctomycetota bacterium]
MKRRVTDGLQRAIAWLLAGMLWCLAKTCRPVGHRDIRHVLRRDGETYLLAALHAHQIGGIMHGDPNIAAMVSRSRDGDWVVPMLKINRITVFRGSAGRAKKGGATAATQMIRHVRQGGAGILTVDGPNGPRGHVHRGIAMMARQTGRPVLAVIVRPRRRWVLSFSWDRVQIPQPFTQIKVHFSRPLRIGPDQSVESFAAEIQREMHRMETWYDPTEAAYSESPPAPLQVVHGDGDPEPTAIHQAECDHQADCDQQADCKVVQRRAA